MTFGCQSIAGLEPQALGLTYWFDAAAEGDPYPVTIRFSGRRAGLKGKPGPGDRFDVVRCVEPVVPGSGPVAITARISNIAPGEWHVTAGPDTGSRVPTSRPASIRRPRLPSASTTATTGYGPILGVLAPGARLGAWPALVGLGVVVGLTTQAVLVDHVGLLGLRVLLVSLVASLVGLAGARLYYWAGHRGEPGSLFPGGTCIQGFVIGATIALLAGASAAGLPAGRLLDVSAPGIFFAMTIGRIGCFLGGCCVGRPTGSRWGLWSSDKRLGCRRIPIQLLESAMALTIGLVALLAVWTTTPRPAGVVFIGAIAAYTFGRQALFPLRVVSHTSRGRAFTIAFTGLIFAVDIAVAVIS